MPVDIGDDNLIDPSAIAAAVGPRTVGVMPTQLNGRTCNDTNSGSRPAGSGLVLVEDSAQALGSRFNGQHAGTFGRAGAFSFFPAKVLGSLGDGGAVVTDSPRLRTRSTNSMTTAEIKMAIRLAGAK